MFSRVLLCAALCAMPFSGWAGGVYWTDRGASQLKRMGFDGSGLQTIPLSGAVTSLVSNFRGIAVDTLGDRIFWADNGMDRLLRVNFDGSAGGVLHAIPGGNSFPADVHLDVLNGHFYWCDSTLRHIRRSTLDGGGIVDVITNAAASGPYFMDLDVPAGKIYWGDMSGGAIYRANLDGSARETLLTGNNSTRGVRVDAMGQMIYWVNRNDRKVHRCPLSAFAGGTIPLTHPAVQTLYTNLDTPHGLALDIPARKIYWADTGERGVGLGGHSICRGDFDGNTPLEVLASGSQPWDVDLDLRCTNYVEWVQRCFRRDAPAEQTAPEADPDGDGIANVLEYAFDLAPLWPDRSGLPAGLMVASTEAPSVYPAIRYRRRAGTADLRYAVQGSPDLGAWTGNVMDPVTLEVDVSALDAAMEMVVARSLQALSEGARQFLRVRVTREP